MLAAVIEVTARTGYPGMTVEGVIARAGVSRRTFYEHFQNKEQAFLAAYDDAVGRLMKHVVDAYAEQARLGDRFRAALSGLLCFLADEPDIARVCIVEVLSAGPAARERRNAIIQTYTDLAEAEIRRHIPTYRTPALTAEMTIGGLYAVVFERVARGDTEALPDLVDDLMYVLMIRTSGA
ncbi:TetR/AcrR family transcriptional regulator [Actinocorallia herbida]|uniref:TetR/AcrR family transcriptional regulator n=1 Tax=Actinocorallia herbida TaxID=58109 RepID=UPI000F4BB02E|nr:TetR/AcrR family transcriptional regulator [Actinocorallia herbida]